MFILYFTSPHSLSAYQLAENFTTALVASRGCGNTISFVMTCNLDEWEYLLLQCKRQELIEGAPALEICTYKYTNITHNCCHITPVFARLYYYYPTFDNRPPGWKRQISICPFSKRSKTRTSKSGCNACDGMMSYLILSSCWFKVSVPGAPWAFVCSVLSVC